MIYLLQHSPDRYVYWAPHFSYSILSYLVCPNAPRCPHVHTHSRSSSFRNAQSQVIFGARNLSLSYYDYYFLPLTTCLMNLQQQKSPKSNLYIRTSPCLLHFTSFVGFSVQAPSYVISYSCSGPFSLFLYLITSDWLFSIPFLKLPNVGQKLFNLVQGLCYTGGRLC